MLRGASGILFMVDSADRKQLSDACAELHHAIEYLDDMNGKKLHHILSKPGEQYVSSIYVCIAAARLMHVWQ